jgi:hypothetical protein
VCSTAKLRTEAFRGRPSCKHEAHLLHDDLPPPPSHAAQVIVNVQVLQKAGAGLHSVSSCYWDKAYDGSTLVRWEGPAFVVVASIYGVKLD